MSPVATELQEEVIITGDEIIASELVLIRYALYFLIIVVLATRFVRGRN